MKPKKPLLSIGIIFKNEIRCLERCLKSFEKLRKTIPCEVVMADTGSTDGSREVAEKYADILFDFPWINDFSAARNAVMDRCSGKWYLTVDADEWLDENIKELVSLVKSDGGNVDKACWMLIRNYYTAADDKTDYGDFLGARLCRMSSGLRYRGTIHESWHNAGTVRIMAHTMLHHDGYANQNAADLKKKRKRNMDLLRKKLEESPDDLKVLMQCAESGQDEPDFLDLLNRAMAAVEDRKKDWESYGPPIFRLAVQVAQWKGLPEFDAWTAKAEELFPKSDFIRIDVQYLAFTQDCLKGNHEECVRRGEDYLRALEDYRAGRGDVAGRIFSTLSMAAPSQEQLVRVMLAVACLRTARADRAWELLQQVEPGKLDNTQLKNYHLLLQEAHGETDFDTAALVTNLWETLFAPETEQKDAENRKNMFKAIVIQSLQPKIREEERKKETFRRYAYTLYLPLRDRCDLGRSAAMLASDDPAEMAELLGQVEDWNELSIYALAHALERGVSFPPRGRPLNVEDMDSLAARLSRDNARFAELALSCAEHTDMEDLAGLTWVRGLLLAAVRAYPWGSKEQDEEQGIAIARAFANVEEKFLPLCYNAEALREDRLFVLPPLHRFGWYCAQAFQALEQGSAVEYVRLLRAGLDNCKGMKDMVKFLADHTAEVQQMMAPPDLKALADQVRVMLARFNPNDPAVAALKQSEAYQKVAWLVEAGSSPGIRLRNDIKIFTFWEPRNSIPPYIKLCMQTWKKFLPNAEIHVLDYSNMSDYIDVKGVYGDRLFSGNFTLPMIADAIRALVLEQHGGVWMDADTILTSKKINKYFQSEKEVAFFGYPAQLGVHLAWISAKEHTEFLRHWVSQCAKKINCLTKKDVESQTFWSYLGNSIINPYILAHPDRIEIIDVMKVGCVPELKFSHGDPYHAYVDFYFKKNLHVKDISSPVLLLHNSWTPPEYKKLPLSQLSRYDCTMSNILMELMQ